MVGAGSVGTRHIRNLLDMGADVTVFRYRKQMNDNLGEIGAGLRVADSLEQAFNDGTDAVVVANRTDQHIAVALAAARKGLNLYIEKPLSNGLAGTNELSDLVREKGLVAEIGFMMRFHPNLSGMKKLIEEEVVGRPYFARAVVGQYLPDWRPGTDYRESYSARREQGGGVILDLIHDLDILMWWFGDVRDVSAMVGYSPELMISSESVAQIQLEFDSGLLASVHMDYLRPAYHRRIEIVGSKGQLTWDYSQGTVFLTVRGSEPKIADRVPEGFERNDMFVASMRHFLSRLPNRDSKAAASLEEGIAVQRIALAAHESSRKRTFVNPLELSMDKI